MYSAAGPAPTHPITAILRTLASRSHAVIQPDKIATISQDRGVGNARPCSAEDLGRTVVRSGLDAKKPAKAARSAIRALLSFLLSGVLIVKLTQFPAKPSRTTSAGSSQLM